ncbi:MAG: acetyl-CoA decarbonylase/synthase complex subunit delta [Candidatus Omnitrophota bacterium]
MELVREKWTSKINTITIGATQDEGGTRIKMVEVGGQTALPFLTFEGENPHPPVIAFEILDKITEDFPPVLKDALGSEINDPLRLAKKAQDIYRVDLICLRFAAAHPDNLNTPAADCQQLMRDILQATGLPLVIIGTGNDEKDNEILPAISEAAKGERVLIGKATPDNYKTLVAACQADGHNIIAESPIDINIAKQVNVLITDLGFTTDRIIIDPTTGGLGYGLEYVYSIMERARIGALGGDKMLAMPFIVFPGIEAWRSKEAKADKEERPEWGNEKLRGAFWEQTTAVSLLLAGADILVMRHPEAISAVRGAITALGKEQGL